MTLFVAYQFFFINFLFFIEIYGFFQIQSEFIDCNKMDSCSLINTMYNSKQNWKYDKYNIFSSPQRNRNIWYNRIIWFILISFLMIILLKGYFSFYNVEFLPEGSNDIFFFFFHILVFESIKELCTKTTFVWAGEQPGWEKYRNRSIPLYISPNEHTAIIEPRTLCKESDPILLLIVIYSKPDNFKHR